MKKGWSGSSEVEHLPSTRPWNPLPALHRQPSGTGYIQISVLSWRGSICVYGFVFGGVRVHMEARG